MTAIVLDGVGKRYRQYRDDAMLVKRILRPITSRSFHDLWALRDISLSVGQGETIGVVGRNGSGKTTLLRLLSGVTSPTVGRVQVRGVRAPLIGIGVGFNQELTGRENVMVNGRLLGMTPAQVRDRFDTIVDFSEIGEFIDVPVKFYSSGMFLRLAFAIAIHTDPDVMLVDEILAVGDVAFQAKCFERMRELQARGATIVVVTHNIQQLQRLAPRTVVLDRGRAVHDGATEDALHVYHEVMQRDAADTAPAAEARAQAAVEVRLLDADDVPTVQARAGQPVTVAVTAELADEVAEPIVGIAVERPGLGLVFATASEPGSYRGTHGPGRPLHARIVLHAVPLLAGTFTIRAVVRVAGRDQPLGLSPPHHFHVSSERPGAGTIDFAPTITIEGRAVPLEQARLHPAGTPVEDRGYR